MGLEVCAGRAAGVAMYWAGTIRVVSVRPWMLIFRDGALEVPIPGAAEAGSSAYVRGWLFPAVVLVRGGSPIVAENVGVVTETRLEEDVRGGMANSGKPWG